MVDVSPPSGPNLDGLRMFEHGWTLDTQLPTSFVAQTCRLFLAPHVQADYVITSDVDMAVLSLRVVETAVSSLEAGDSEFAVVRDVLPDGQIAICYCIGTPKAWARIVGDVPLTELESVLRGVLSERTVGLIANLKRGGEDWFLDQKLLYEGVTREERNGLKVVRLQDWQTGHKRLDRSGLKTRASRLAAARGVLFGEFSDFHFPLPVDGHLGLMKTLLLLSRIGSQLRRLAARPPGSSIGSRR